MMLTRVKEGMRQTKDLVRDKNSGGTLSMHHNHNTIGNRGSHHQPNNDAAVLPKLEAQPF
jgi:hypothetical protein